MEFVSTRNKNISISGHNAIIKGLADDGGLFVPPSITSEIDPQSLVGKSYQTIAKAVLSVFFDDLSEEEINQCIMNAYDRKFDTAEIVPVRKIRNGYLMDLWHGPTSAFKDIALTILPHLLTASYQKENLHQTVSILTATSGDTGKAALSGFADVPNTAVTVFYPEDGVSAVQKAQMQTSRGNNISVIAVKGNFDDCQRMVKEACSASEVLNACKNVSISSANSINVGRLFPQVVYYYSTYCRLVENEQIKLGDSVNFIVPTGNFGDIFAGYIAKSLGLPVNKLICASNSNNVLCDFIRTGEYNIKRDFKLTMSPSMDILISSNLERLLYFVSDYDVDFVASCMDDLKENGAYAVSDEVLSRIQKDFDAYWVTEAECTDTIKKLYEEEHVLIDPHTAVALCAMYKYQNEYNDKNACVVLSTASPFKFASDVLKAISDKNPSSGFEAMKLLSAETGLDIPSGLAELESLPIRFTEVIEKSEGISRIARRMEEVSNG